MTHPRILLLVSTTSYRIGDFLQAAEELDVDVCVGSNQRHILEALSNGGTLTVDFEDLEAGTRQIADYHQQYPIAAIIGVDDETTALAATASQHLHLNANPPQSITYTRNKYLLRNALANSGLPAPRFSLFNTQQYPATQAKNLKFPLVLKPLALSASRGVIRVNNLEEFEFAFERIKNILTEFDVSDETNQSILAEDYIAGREVAVEGILSRGTLTLLALFDKPDPLEGPFFEETIYVTPSRLPLATQREIIATSQKAITHLGLSEGAIHAELRINDEGVWLIEVAARSIGGNCARTLRTTNGPSLEQNIIQNALGASALSNEHQSTQPATASAVMMIPTPCAGILKAVNGLDEARQIVGITEISINIQIGQLLVPVPEGNRYLGFIFANAPTPREAEARVRQAHALLTFSVDQTERD